MLAYLLAILKTIAHNLIFQVMAIMSWYNSLIVITLITTILIAILNLQKLRAFILWVLHHFWTCALVAKYALLNMQLTRDKMSRLLRVIEIWKITLFYHAYYVYSANLNELLFFQIDYYVISRKYKVLLDKWTLISDLF